MATSFYSIYNRENAGAEALKRGLTQSGVPYEWGGTSPGIGFDCSGLSMWEYATVGVPLLRTSQEQFREYEIGRGVPLLPGDQLFIPGSDGTEALPGHVMTYVSPGKVLQAPFTGEDVGVYDYDTSVYVYATRPANFYGALIVGPTEEQLKDSGLVRLESAAAATLALKNGYVVRGFNKTFEPLPLQGVPVGVVKYASKNFHTPNHRPSPKKH